MIGTMRNNPRGLGALRWLAIALFAILTPIACAPPVEEQGNAAVITLASSSLAGGIMPGKYACGGAGISPALSWTAPPAATQSFALVVTDLDGPKGFIKRHLFVHWVIYGLPAAARELPEGIPPSQQQLADGTVQGKNGNYGLGYAGPCPPGNAAHRYAFTLYALDAKPDLPAGANEHALRDAMRGHIVGRGQLIASYQR
jgi:Raf kinase inhibitor-like YbhB/YbcL family protein